MTGFLGHCAAGPLPSADSALWRFWEGQGSRGKSEHYAPLPLAGTVSGLGKAAVELSVSFISRMSPGVFRSSDRRPATLKPAMTARRTSEPSRAATSPLCFLRQAASAAPRWVLAGLDFRFDAQFRADASAARSQGRFEKFLSDTADYVRAPNEHGYLTCERRDRPLLRPGR